MSEKYGLGKYRTPFGKWLDDHKKTSVEFAVESGVHRNTIDALAGQKGYGARKPTMDKVLKVAKKIDPEATYEKLFPPM
ncbi:transcriptional regulator [Brevibacillus formosus]|uniref:transcriptional regulator n=1 Tax=Brevibacillus formosus TaxID=54913 RepID=UPI0018CF62E7|nr:transcriptional regulator [Brevibacillus formosus]MBG9941760.1 hypothetical protein [Brevibacillus formosus]